MGKAKKTPHSTKVAVFSPPFGFTPIRVGLAIFAVSVLLYANTLGHGYTQDDAIVITENIFTQQGIEGLGDIFRYDTFRGFFKDANKANLVSGGRYRPLTLATFAIELEAFGQTPIVGHLFNALYYGITCMLLYWLVLRWMSPGYPNGSGQFAALVTALLFLSHPIHTEAVANIKGRDEIFSLMFSLTALLVAFRSLRNGKYGGHMLAGGLFFLALLSKENALVFVVIAPLSMWFFSKKRLSQIVRFSLPWWAAAAVMLLIRFSVIPPSGGSSMELMNNPFLKIEDGRWVAFTFGEWSATVMYTLGKYLQLMVFPHPLVHDYYPRQIPIMSWLDWRVVISLIACSLLMVYALVRLPRKDPVSFGILFYFIALFPVSNILITVGTNMSERFLFLPSAGICLAVAALSLQLASRLKATNQGVSVSLQRYFWAVVLIATVFAIKTIDRNRAWKDNFTLFTTDVRTAPNSAKLRNSAGGELIAAAILPANSGRRQDFLLEAVGHLEQAITIHPTYKNAYLLLGNAHNYLEKYDEAVGYYEQALQLDPGYPEASTNLFLTLRQAGRYYGEQKNDLVRSLDYLGRALELQPGDYETLRLLGIANGIRGDHSNAIRYFTMAAESEPQNAQAWWNLGNAWYHAGDTDKQSAMHLRARQIDPEIGQKQQQQ